MLNKEYSQISNRIDPLQDAELCSAVSKRIESLLGKDSFSLSDFREYAVHMATLVGGEAETDAHARSYEIIDTEQPLSFYFSRTRIAPKVVAPMDEWTLSVINWGETYREGTEPKIHETVNYYWDSSLSKSLVTSHPTLFTLQTSWLEKLLIDKKAKRSIPASEFKAFVTGLSQTEIEALRAKENMVQANFVDPISPKRLQGLCEYVYTAFSKNREEIAALNYWATVPKRHLFAAFLHTMHNVD